MWDTLTRSQNDTRLHMGQPISRWEIKTPLRSDVEKKSKSRSRFVRFWQNLQGFRHFSFGRMCMFLVVECNQLIDRRKLVFCFRAVLSLWTSLRLCCCRLCKYECNRTDVFEFSNLTAPLRDLQQDAFVSNLLDIGKLETVRSIKISLYEKSFDTR